MQKAVIWGPKCPLAVIPGSGRLPRSALAAVRGRAAWPGTNNLPVARQRRATGRLVTTSARAGVAGRTESPAAPRFVDVAWQPPRRCQGNEGRLFPVLKEQEPVLGPARRPGNCREKKQFLPTTGTVSGFGGWVRSTPALETEREHRAAAVGISTQVFEKLVFVDCSCGQVRSQQVTKVCTWR